MPTQADVAEHLDLSERRVRDLTKDGILPGSKGRGGYDLDACRLAYITYLRGIGSGQTSAPEPPRDPDDYGGDDDEGFIDAEREEARRKKYDADLKKERLKILRRENAPVDIITDVVGKQMEMVSAQLRALPMQIKLAAPMLTSRSIELIQKTIANMCNQLIDVKPDLNGYSPVDPDGDSAGDGISEGSTSADGS